MTPRILVCGGRDYSDRYRVFDELDKISLERGWTTKPTKHDFNYLANVFVIVGSERGADSHALDWAITNWCNFRVYRADWEGNGKAAGPIRNKRMLDEGKPDLVVAFPGGKGTANMIKQAKKAGVEVIEIA